MPTKYEVDAVIEDVRDAVLEPYGVEDFSSLDQETQFTIANGCLAVAIEAAVAAAGSKDDARAWFERMLRNPDRTK